MRLPVVRSCLRFLDIVRLETGSKPPLIRLMVGARDCSVLPRGRTCPSGGGRPMSALGQKQTCAAHKLMSALPPKADMCGARSNVCFGPKADIEDIHSITSSARDISACGTLIPSVFAVF